MEFVSLNSTLLDNCKNESFAGHDPFDALNSKFLNGFPKLKYGFLGLAWLQFHKRLPINLRPFCNIPKKRNPKGLALFILGLIEDYQRTGDDNYIREAANLADWLITQRCDKSSWHHSCWGYHFDWNARAFFVPKGKPNVITTIYVSKALLALGELTSNQDYIDAALDSANFIVKHLYKDDEEAPFIAYIPGETAFVHNASLWGAAWIATVGARTSNTEFMDIALRVARRSAQAQASDGAWVYGARDHHQFIDGFHTGYNLEALHEIKLSLQISEFDNVIEKGLEYYKRELIESDGTAKYYHNNRYPLDMHSVAQAVITLLKVDGSQSSIELARKIINRSIELMYMPDKHRFVYQKHKYYTNSVNYMRWTQAWVYYSFSYFNLLDAEKNNATD